MNMNHAQVTILVAAHLLTVVLHICQVILQVTVQVFQINDDTCITPLEVFWNI
jgi:hypothetical protein